MKQRILLSNMGYARNISGSFAHHMLFSYRHFHASHRAQKKSLDGLKRIIHTHNPDICCLLEIDRGSVNNAHFNQIHALIDPHYHFYDIENKYAAESKLAKMSVSNGKCNGFIAKSKYDYQKLYLSTGAKRLVYQLKLSDSLTLFFTHFSLKKETRRRQFADLRSMVKDTPGEVIIMGDFNIFSGFQEAGPLLDDLPLTILSNPRIPTFTFARWKMCLDLCIVSESLAERCQLQVIPQPYSDHDALLLEINASTHEQDKQLIHTEKL